MISRHWKGIAKNEMSDSYMEHLKKDTFPKLAKIKGFIRSSILGRKVARGTEFLIITEWESLEAIKAFAGEEAETAVVPQVVQEMMIDYDRKATHYEVMMNYE
ncbi:MAG: antibiotic biosynthesis monooxygenase [Desulfobacteraceae bacterium]|nr:MAG: antibiotic biosynthesis monooxygenase [Desulfobacteraceae bacterium]